MTFNNPFDNATSLFAAHVMTPRVIIAAANDSVRVVARLLLEHRIGAVPVAGPDGAPVGIVSDGDLLGRRAQDDRREWWLQLLAQGAATPDLAAGAASDRSISEVMTAPLITISPSTPLQDIATMLRSHRIKRLPVVEDGRMVGIVSRTDLLGAIGGASSKPIENQAGKSLLGFLESLIGGHLLSGIEKSPAAPPPQSGGRDAASVVSAATLRAQAKAFRVSAVDERLAARRSAEIERRRAIKSLLEQHVDAALWREVLDSAQSAARQGESEVLMLRFPSDLCSDGGRMIDIAQEGWPSTLRGEAAELYARWRQELKPQGLGLSARIVSYDEDGVIGDIGLYLTWRE